MAEKKMSPMMVQYLETKKDYPDTLLFFRIGDFYEMFFEDAKVGAEALDLVLTGKDCGTGERAPMCGIPFHAADSYVSRLVAKGFKVAIAEQMEDPKTAKGIVKREVIRVITPGTLTSELVLEQEKNNFLMSIYRGDSGYGVANVDISTGEFLTTVCAGEKELLDEISRFSPAEIVCNHAFLEEERTESELKERFGILLTELSPDVYKEQNASKVLEEHFRATLDGLGLRDKKAAMLACAAALSYVYDTQKGQVKHISGIRYYVSSQYMILDASTQRNLELTETMREKKKRGTLLWVLDKTKTAMGARLLRRFVEQPLISRGEILRRQDSIEELNAHFIDREEIAEYLGAVYDLERILGRISYQSANPRDLVSFKTSLGILPDIRNLLKQFEAPLLREIYQNMDELRDLYTLVNDALVEDPPVSAKDGGLIREGYHEEADRYRAAGHDGKQWLSNLEAEEREKTGIKTLRIKYNRIFGYCFEVSNSFRDQVPDYFIRKQTLTGAERYTTDRLEELQNIILGAEEKLHTLEYTLFCEIRDRIGENIGRVQQTSRNLALLDCMISLSKVSQENRYVRPAINEEGTLRIQDGRHPVIEKLLTDDSFVTNSTVLDDHDNRIAIITGPNMAGKSTYMRQVALIVLMASIGSFVPATEADISICDRIFTRVGASDDLASGQSTFMVEMNEVANILRNASGKSLLILDEIGRGTSTFDGLSIAWSVVEYISHKVQAKTLFATHYHELTELEGKLPGVNNYCISVSKHDNDIVFLRKIVPGGADQSYGIDVAKLAGVPGPVIRRAKEIAAELERADISGKTRNIAVSEAISSDEPEAEQGNDGRQTAELLRTLRGLDVNRLTPLEAMNILFELKEMSS